VHDVARAGHAVARPLLHGCSIDVLSRMLRRALPSAQERKIHGAQADSRGRTWSWTHIECHPGDRLILWDLGPLDQPQCQGLIVEDNGEDGSWRGPGADDQVVKHFGGGGGVEGSSDAKWADHAVKEWSIGWRWEWEWQNVVW